VWLLSCRHNSQRKTKVFSLHLGWLVTVYKGYCILLSTERYVMMSHFNILPRTPSKLRGEIMHLCQPAQSIYDIRGTFLKIKIFVVRYLLVPLGWQHNQPLWIIHYGAEADLSGRAVEDVGLRLLAYWNCAFESRQGHEFCLTSVVCCQVEVSALGWSPVQKCPTECGMSNWVW
jgi:hypothetical protein